MSEQNPMGNRPPGRENRGTVYGRPRGPRARFGGGAHPPDGGHSSTERVVTRTGRRPSDWGDAMSQAFPKLGDAAKALTLPSASAREETSEHDDAGTRDGDERWLTVRQLRDAALAGARYASAHPNDPNLTHVPVPETEPTLDIVMYYIGANLVRLGGTVRGNRTVFEMLARNRYLIRDMGDAALTSHTPQELMARLVMLNR